MRTLIITTILALSFSSLPAQTEEEEMARLKQEVDGVVLEQADGEEVPAVETSPGHWNFSVGTSYSFMRGYGSGMMFYAAPAYTLALNDRWALHGGIVASYYQGMNQTLVGENYFPATLTSLAMFAAASYRMNDRLVLHGAGTKQLIEGPGTLVMGYPMDNLSLGATYRIGDNLTIGASVHMRNWNGYNGYNGFNSAGFGSPFYPSPFGW